MPSAGASSGAGGADELPAARGAGSGAVDVAGTALEEGRMNYLPSWEQVLRVLTLSDFNTRVVVVSVAMLGMAAGIVGTFTLLRKRALVSDTVSHATLPGIAVAWLVMVALGGTGKWFPGLLLGAAAGGLAAIAAVLVVRSVARLHEDAALGIVLSVSFGIGIALLGLIQQMRRGSAAGLDSFIYGKTASMLAADAMLIGVTSLILLVIAALLFKELNLLCFDAPYAASQGLPVGLLDVVMLGLVVAVTVIGLQAVGLILIVALLITPAAAARFWTHDLRLMTVLAALIGATGGFIGAGLSALVPRLPAGAVIVVTTAAGFVISVLFGTRRGLLRLLLERRRSDRRIRREHLLRAVFEQVEAQLGAPPGRTELAASAVDRAQLAQRRGWTRAELAAALRVAQREGWLQRPVRERTAPPVRPAASGKARAARQRPAAAEAGAARQRPRVTGEARSAGQRPAAAEAEAARQRPRVAGEVRAARQRPRVTGEMRAARQRPAAAETGAAGQWPRVTGGARSARQRPPATGGAAWTPPRPETSGQAGPVRLTPAGAAQALQIVRNHRLWELYLIEHAEVATSRVDRGADRIEHVLEPELVAELEAQLDRQTDSTVVAASPHALAPEAP